MNDDGVTINRRHRHEKNRAKTELQRDGYIARRQKSRGARKRVSRFSLTGTVWSERFNIGIRVHGRFRGDRYERGSIRETH